jgi:hypothetical protein
VICIQYNKSKRVINDRSHKYELKQTHKKRHPRNRSHNWSSERHPRNRSHNWSSESSCFLWLFFYQTAIRPSFLTCPFFCINSNKIYFLLLYCTSNILSYSSRCYQILNCRPHKTKRMCKNIHRGWYCWYNRSIDWQLISRNWLFI